ncbi:MAG: hypothetical protein V7733_10880 [Paraglaciecola polaris]|uniref:hypothetical protein n=1 Tax=Paraglaciecola polaris TaxID=222814 RepID=UPI0030031156|tara:strand:- start:5504 stop:5833 length:330 start_codon:yes stop_codon:yes gene_type:complete
MRAFLLFIGWSSIISSFVDGALGFYALWIISSSEITDFYLSLDVFLKQYVEFIYWVKQVALLVMPKAIAIWLFGIPALIYFPVRILISIVIGWWALNKIKSIDVQRKII